MQAKFKILCIIPKWLFMLLDLSLHSLDFTVMVSVFAPSWRPHVEYAVLKKKKSITLKYILNLLVRALSTLIICIEHIEAKKHAMPSS